jgi:hypothetical protein
MALKEDIKKLLILSARQQYVKNMFMDNFSSMLVQLFPENCRTINFEIVYCSEGEGVVDFPVSSSQGRHPANQNGKA